jgi:hypothetical protein
MAINKDFIIPDAGLEVGTNATVAGALGVNTSISVGNSTVNATANATSIRVGNTTVNAALTQNSLTIGTFSVNSSSFSLSGTLNTTNANVSTNFNVGSNVNITTSRITVGNSTVNTFITSNNLTTNGTIIASGVGTFGGAVVTGIANVGGALNVTGNTVISGTTNITGAATFSNTVIISGNLTVSGTTTYVNTAVLNVADNIITLNADVTGAPTENAGIEVNRGTSSNVSLIWNETTDRWQVSSNTTNFGNIHTTLNDVVLGTDTSGNYVATITAGNGLTGSATGEGSTPTIAVVAGTELAANSTGVHHVNITRTDTTTGNTAPNYSGAFTAVDSITTNARGHVTAVNTKTVTMPASNNTTYGLATVANTAVNVGLARLTGSDSTTANIQFIGQDEITVSSNATAVYIDHNDIARTNTTSSQSPASGGTFTALDSITTNARGHVTAVNTKTVTLPVDPNTTYDLTLTANTARGVFNLVGSDATTDTVSVFGLDDITVSSNAAGVYVDHNDIGRTNTTSGNTSPNYGGTFTAVDSITTNARGHVTAVNTKTVTMPSSNNTTYSIAAIANTVANEGIFRLTGSNSTTNDFIIRGLGTTTVQSNTTAVYISSADQFTGTVTSVSGTGTVNGITLTGTVTGSGNLTLGGSITAGSTSTAGIVQLTDSTSSTSTTTAATPNSVRLAFNNGSTAYSNAVSVASADATSKAATAYTNAITFAANASNISSGTVAAARLPTANTTATGITQLTDSTSSTSTTTAATPNSVRLAFNNGSTAYSNAVSVASADATTKAGTAYTNAITFAANASNISSGTVAAARLPTGSTAASGIVQLTDSTSSTSTTTAATPNSVRLAFNNAATAYSNAVSVAAADATTKAGTAYTNAITFAANATNLTNGTIPYARIPANIVNTTASFTFSGIQTYNANIVMSASRHLVMSTTSGVSANGTLGSSGQALLTNGTGVYWGTPATGTITGVTAGNGLTGGGTSGNVTLNVGQGTGISVNSTAVSVTSPTLRHVSSGYTSGGQVFVSGTQPTASNQGDIWIEI